MAQTPEGAVKVAAQAAGCLPDEYRRRVAAGEKWCTLDRAWHPKAEFGRDGSRPDGLAASCRQSRRDDGRRRYVPSPAPEPGRSYVAARDGDREQARGRVNYLVRMGLLPDPNTLSCVDCGHVWNEGERRHEYDHNLGYEAEHHEHVEPVCTTCHARRARDRGEVRQVRGARGRYATEGVME